MIFMPYYLHRFLQIANENSMPRKELKKVRADAAACIRGLQARLPNKPNRGSVGKNALLCTANQAAGSGIRRVNDSVKTAGAADCLNKKPDTFCQNQCNHT